MLDKEQIKSDADALVVAQALGMAVHRRNAKYLILCPCHNDRTIGSCYLDSKGFKCYSCNTQGDVFDLVMSYLGIDFNDAMRYVANICGGEEYYRVEYNKEIEQKIGFISRAECKKIKLYDSPVYVAFAYTFDYEEAKQFRSEGYQVVCEDEPDNEDEDHLPVYVIKKIATTSPLFDLYRSDKDSYHQLVDDFCHRQMEALEYVFQIMKDPFLCGDESIRDSILKIRQSISQQDLVVCFKELFGEITRISGKHGAGNCVYTSTNIVAEWASSIWEKEVKGAF